MSRAQVTRVPWRATSAAEVAAETLRQDRRWLAPEVARLPVPLQAGITRAWERKRARARAPGNAWLLATVETVTAGLLPGLSAASGDAEICAYAALRARAAESALRAGGLAAALRGALAIGVPAPVAETDAGQAARLKCPQWWRRSVRRTHARGIERGAILAGLVHERAGIYCSDAALRRRLEQQARNAALLEELEAVNEAGQSYTLAELAALGMANPKLRRAELMTRIAGFEQIARTVGHAAEFYTWTCPSRMHARLSGSGAENSRYDGTSPREAQAYLSRQWSRARAALARAGVAVYGFRVAEPHHDGCPHWHMLFFMAADAVPTVRAVLRRYALQVDGTEPGADKHRFKVEAIDPAKGSAAGYIAKYIAKAIDGFGVGEDLYGKDAKASARRIEAWASTWGIRQFQQIGGPSVTVWRELRRLRAAVTDRDIERARFAADMGDWAGYIQAQGGVSLPRDMRPVQLAMQWNDAPGRYDEAKGWRVFGVQAGAAVVETRAHVWTIARKGAAPVTAQKACRARAYIGFYARGGLSAPWSPVNNCTEGFCNVERAGIRDTEGGVVGREKHSGLCQVPAGGGRVGADSARYAGFGSRADNRGGAPGGAYRH